MTGQPIRTDVTIVGAGPCGLTTALALRHHGFEDVTVFDRFPEIRPALGAAFSLNLRQKVGEWCSQFMGHISAELLLASISGRLREIWRKPQMGSPRPLE